MEVVRDEDRPARVWLRALRPHQWIKNLLLFLPALAAHGTLGTSWLTTLLGCVAFCAAAAGLYVVNDLIDLEADRHHASKRYRPIAAGRLAIRHAMGLAAGLLIVAGLLAFATGLHFAIVLCVYCVAALAYSGFLKRIVLLDIALLSGFYVLRVVAGAAASAIPVSAWLVTFCFTFFLALATVKRQTELTRAAAATVPIRGRGYRQDHSGWLTALGVLAAGAASVILIAYGFSPSAAVLYDQPTLFSWVAAPVGMWLAHTLYEGRHGRVDDDPVVYALRAYSSYLAIGAIGVVVAAAL